MGLSAGARVPCHGGVVGAGRGPAYAVDLGERRGTVGDGPAGRRPGARVTRLAGSMPVVNHRGASPDAREDVRRRRHHRNARCQACGARCDGTVFSAAAVACRRCADAFVTTLLATLPPRTDGRTGDGAPGARGFLRLTRAGWLACWTTWKEAYHGGA